MPKHPGTLGLLDRPQGGREPGDDLGEDQQGHAVADAALGDQLAEPHDHGGAGGHGHDHDQEGGGAVAVQQALVAALEQIAGPGERDDAGRLEDGESEGQVAGVLGDLGLTGLTLLLERLEPRDDHDEQLQDDAGGDVGHDPQREDRQLEKGATGEQVDQVVEAGTVLWTMSRQAWTLATLTPGAGIWEPSRKIAMINRTNSSLRRRSGVRKAFANALSTRSSFSKRDSGPCDSLARTRGSLTGASCAPECAIGRGRPCLETGRRARDADGQERIRPPWWFRRRPRSSPWPSPRTRWR